MNVDRSAGLPTDGELAILNVLWRRGSSTVREVHDELRAARGVGYTTVLKLMQIMTEKGLVFRKEVSRAHVYAPTESEEQSQRNLVRDLIDRAFEGSAGRLVMRALSTQRASASDLAEIRKLLDKLEGGAP